MPNEQFCSVCGKQRIEPMQRAQPIYPQQAGYEQDAPSRSMMALGFFVPVVGLVLYLVWKDQTPLKAKSAGKGALIGFIVELVLSFLIPLLTFVITFFAF